MSDEICCLEHNISSRDANLFSVRKADRALLLKIEFFLVWVRDKVSRT